MVENGQGSITGGKTSIYISLEETKVISLEVQDRVRFTSDRD